jgi:micrococcal nuclease
LPLGGLHVAVAAGDGADTIEVVGPKQPGDSLPGFVDLGHRLRGNQQQDDKLPGTVTREVSFVRDGDTIELDAMTIRCDGIAAPEWDTPAGEAATKALREMVLGKLVSCELTGKATYNRCVAVSYLDGIDIEAEMVRTGLARDCPRYSGGRHADAERAAAADGATIAAT